METSLHYISFTQKNNMRNASFASYVTPEEPKADDSELSIFDAQKYFNENNDQKENNRVLSLADVKNAEQQCHHLSALPRLSSASSAEGYRRNYRARSFHATPTASSEASWNSQTGLLANPPGSVPVSLRNLPGHGHERKTVSSTTAKWLNFRRKCPCAGKKSVQVEENISPRTSDGVDSSCTKRHSSKSADHQNLAERKEYTKSQKSSAPHDHYLVKGSYEREIPNPDRFSPENHFATEIAHQRVLRPGRSFTEGTGGPGRSFTEGTGGFSFPILNPSTPVKLVLKNSSAPPITALEEDPPRDSLEVFHPLDETIPNKSSHPGVGRDRHGFGFPVSPTSRMTATDDDVASNASSDLFEIESFSTQTTSYPMYRRRDSLDEASNFNARRLAGSTSSGGLYCRSLDEPMTPSIEPTDCYEPSEASIDWSVTTAEGFDRASVTNFSVSASEFDDIPATRGGGGAITMYGSRGGGRGDESKRRGNGGLLSCRHEKAVSVGPQPVKCGSEGHWNASSATAMGFSSKTRHVSSRPHPHTFNKPPLAHGGSHAHSARLSLAFAT